MPDASKKDALDLHMELVKYITKLSDASKKDALDLHMELVKYITKL